LRFFSNSSKFKFYFVTGTVDKILKIFLKHCNDGLGECTAFTRCSNSTLFTDGGDFFDVRFNPEEETDACHYLEMCCDPEDVIRQNERNLKTNDYDYNDETSSKSPATDDNVKS
jgi:hypothetical protein